MKVLVVSVHPDDETLGCGGTLLKHKKQGDELFWLIVTDVTEKQGYTQEYIVKRKKQIEEVSKKYLFKKTSNFKFQSTKLHLVDFSEIIEQISSVVQEIQPEVIYTVNRSDIHTDHQIAARAVISSTKSFRNQCIKRILMYECVSETEMAPPFPENVFVPHVYSDISEFIEQKIEIMKLYESELQAPPFPRSVENIRALARYRGSSISVQYAESFMLCREIF